MVYTELTKKAMKLAYEKHAGQTDRGGMPYIFHPIHLAEQMATEREVCVALLHDILEDTTMVPQELRDMGFPDEWVDDIKYLTKAPVESYEDYIQLLARHPVPRKVKLADLIHNADLSRLKKIRPEDVERSQKYIYFAKILDKWSEK